MLQHGCDVVAHLFLCSWHVPCLQADTAGVPAPLAEQAAAAAAELKKHYPDRQPGGHAAGAGNAATTAGGDPGSTVSGDRDTEQQVWYDDEESPSELAARQQRREDWQARGQWGPEPEGSAAELAHELLNVRVANPGDG